MQLDISAPDRFGLFPTRTLACIVILLTSFCSLVATAAELDDSDEAARRLARSFVGGQFGKAGSDNVVAKKLGESRHRAAIVQELEKRLNERDFVPGFYFLYTLAELDSEAQLPTGAALKFLDEAPRQRYAKTAADARYDRQQLLLAGYAEMAWRAMPNKTSAARAATAFSLFILRESRHLPRDATFRWTTAQLRQIIQPGFLLLSDNEQWLLLSKYWRRLGGPPLVPSLVKLIETAPEPVAPLERDDETPTRLDTAFERLLAVSPDEGRRLIIDEIRREQPRVIMKTLLLLPDQPIPELDELLVRRLEMLPKDGYDRSEPAPALVNRYASAALLELVQRVVRGLAEQEFAGAYPSLLCYWLKHAPRSGAAMLDRALDQREQGHHSELLSGMRSIRLDPELLPISLQRLRDPEMQVVESAASVLGSFGTPAARQALKDRLRRWHDDLIAAEPDAKEKIAQEGYNGPHGVFDSFILQDLQRSPITVLTPQELRDLNPLCMTKQALEEIHFCLVAWTDPIKISFREGEESEFEHPGWPSAGGGDGFGSVDDTWHVASQYTAWSKAELKLLLARFPRGSTFALPRYISTDANEFRRLFDELRADVEKHGMKLVQVEK